MTNQANTCPSIAAYARKMQGEAMFKARYDALKVCAMTGVLPALTCEDFAALLALSIEGVLIIPDVNNTPAWQRDITIA